MAQKECEECGLVFARLQYTSNKAAKKKLRKFDTDFIIYTNQYPSDLTWWKVLLMTFFTGICGGHYYYTGKYIKGGLMSASFVYLIFAVVFNAEWSQKSETYLLYLPIGIAGLAWMVSLVYVAFKKYKVPVIVEIPEQEVIDKKVEYDRNATAKTTNETAEVVIADKKETKAKKKGKKKAEKQQENSLAEEIVVEENKEEKTEQIDPQPEVEETDKPAVQEAKETEKVVEENSKKKKTTKSKKNEIQEDKKEEE